MRGLFSGGGAPLLTPPPGWLLCLGGPAAQQVGLRAAGETLLRARVRRLDRLDLYLRCPPRPPSVHTHATHARLTQARSAWFAHCPLPTAHCPRTVAGGPALLQVPSLSSPLRPDGPAPPSAPPSPHPVCCFLKPPCGCNCSGRAPRRVGRVRSTGRPAPAALRAGAHPQSMQQIQTILGMIALISPRQFPARHQNTAVVPRRGVLTGMPVGVLVAGVTG